MRITFVAIGSEQLAISLLSGLAKKHGHEVSLAFSPSLFHDRSNMEIPSLAKYFDDTEILYQQIREQTPDVIAFSVLTATYQWSLQVAGYAKTIFPNIKTVFGGVHISAVPQRVIKREVVDYLVVGEGEHAFIKILERIASGEKADNPIDNTWFKAATGEVIRGHQVGFNQELDDLPAYDKTIWEDHIRISDKYMTMASRGCPYRCSFCFNNFFARLPEEKNKGKYVRFRSVDHMINELKAAKERYGYIKYVDFQDDVFTANKKWLREFLTRYKEEINIPFQCLTHPKYMDEEIAQWMSEAGCKWIQMGVQSMDEDFKKEHLQRYERSDDIVEACRVMKKYGISAKLDHMFGLPEEPISAQENARKLYVQYPPRRIQTFWTVFLPGTDMFKEALESGLLTREEADLIEEGIGFLFYHSKDNVYYSEQAYLYKRYNFIFKIMPLFPRVIREKLTTDNVAWIPQIVCRPIAFIADLLTGLSYKNPDFIAYFLHYSFHLWRWFVRHMTGIVLKAINIKSLMVPEKQPLKIPTEKNADFNRSTLQRVVYKLRIFLS